MLARMNPLVECWYFTDLPTPRAALGVDLMQSWTVQNPRKDVSASAFSSPQLALQEALRCADPTDRILVFGSFYTVGGVLQQGLPRLSGAHLASS
jgi:dihydrofolate synthase/folylpolyglutamate synthase